MHLTSRLNHVLTKAEDEQRALKDDFLSVEHLLLAMVQVLLAEGRVDAGRIAAIADGWERVAARLSAFTPERATAPRKPGSSSHTERLGCACHARHAPITASKFETIAIASVIKCAGIQSSASAKRRAAWRVRGSTRSGSLSALTHAIR